MKKNILQLVIAVIFLAAIPVSAQNYATHAVKEGETLQSISQKYKVTPYSILQANKEIKSASDVKVNTMLIIPLNGTVTVEEKKPAQEEQEEEKPIGYTRHRVKRKETMFGLTQKYKVTEDQIKRYNRQLYSEQLKKGMVLQIPKFPKVDPDEERDLDFETYTVQPKETRWSIAHKYGITVDSLLLLNPDLDKTTNYLATGQQLKLPRPKGDSLKEQQVDLFTSYTVPPKMTLYSLGREYGIPSDSIVKLNPEVMKQGGLKEGMVIRLPKKRDASGAVNTENFIFYEVKPKQNIFRITQNLKISREELFRLNPELENGLKAGMVLKLPKEKAVDLEVKNALVLDKINLIDSIDVKNRPKLVFMLPFRLDRVNVNDREKAESMIKNRRDLALSLGFYTGALVALDSIKKLGVSVDVKTYDTELSQTKVKEILFRENLNGVNAIIGPVSSEALNEVAVQAASRNIPVVSPIASESKLSHGNVFFSVPRDAVLREKMLTYMKKIYKGENVIIVADSTHQVAHDSILSKFPAAQIAKIIDNKSLHLDRFLVKLSEDKENWVFLETDQPNMVSSVSSILNSANTEKIKVRMFTTSYNGAFEDDAVSMTHLSNLKFTYPSFYREADNDTFVRAYEKRYNGLKPDRYAVRGFDVTFDILLKLAHKNNLFETSKIIGLTEYTGNSFDYLNDWASGYFNRACYIMKYEDLQIKEVNPDDIKSNL
ncbi:ABC-type branched-chain amino acid transport system, substrate-binding protein [Flagellimonas taeanensis]|uniref:ABC-type branched-chain amino acid transport system, substrate-binding protein n=1 Tax=Flagellimonas taeanensis TaxID=1005926 RepID=A0A1M7CA42_9FLAO|nr:LysM peptidoglycan-binding domain-containing protein [Allomuricauda taeanensis]SFC61236.1 ABC-type branched-chain amino acid transport system, substrate-binding protein [Allomuricauda taeanensis]SHL63749.1 amino acid/amide ABC transporter substrate-binding protein, HAAT family [Allomuricauda taeanensis]